MTTIIDSLIVELNLDPSKMKRSQREALDDLRKFEDDAKKRGGNVEKSVMGMEGAFSTLQKRLLGVAALFIGGLGIERMVSRITQLQVAASNLGQTFGIQSQMIQRWGAAGERLGVPGSAVQQGLTSLQQQRFNLQNFGDPSGILSLSWGTRGTNNPLVAQAPNGQMLPPDQLAMNIAKWLQKAGPQGANALMRMGGLSQDFVTFLMQGPEKIRKVLEDTKKLAPSDEEIGKFKQLNEAMAEMSQKTEAAGRKITSEFVPAMVKILDVVGKIAEIITNPLGRSEKEIVDGLNKNRPGGQTFLEEEIRRKEAELKANTESLLGAKGLYRAPLEAEQRKLTDEIRKLREQLEREKQGNATVQKQSFLSPSDDNVRVFKASLGGGGGFRWRPRWDSDGMGGGTPDFGNASPMGRGRASGGEGTGLKGDRLQNARKIYETLRSLGHSHEQASGALGHISAESGFNPRVRGDHGTAFGFFQMRGERWRNHLAFAKKHGLDPFSPEAGARFFDWELRNDPGNAGRGVAERYFGSKTIDQSVHALNGYERFRGWQFGQPGRYSAARRFGGSMRFQSEEAGVPLPRVRPGTGDLSSLMGFSRMAASGGGGGSSSSQSFTVGNVHIYPEKVDGDLGSTLRPNLTRYAKVASANYGPA